MPVDAITMDRPHLALANRMKPEMINLIISIAFLATWTFVGGIMIRRPGEGSSRQ